MAKMLRIDSCEECSCSTFNFMGDKDEEVWECLKYNFSVDPSKIDPLCKLPDAPEDGQPQVDQNA